jgi:predicted ATPase
MHPDMVRMTADMLVSASERPQLIITTHSEALLTALEEHFDKLFAFNWGPNGSVVQELTRSDYEEFRSEYPLGQLWSSGELGGVRW